jgi:hypothetical protein
MPRPVDDRKKKAPNRRPEPSRGRVGKKSYATPTLREFGAVAELTQGNLSHGNDPTAGNARKT